MKNLKLELFNFNKGLEVDDTQLLRIVESYIDSYDTFSEKELYTQLNEKLSKFGWDTRVKGLLESIEQELDSAPLSYTLKDLYKKVERKNYGMLYRPALNSILNIINLQDDNSRTEAILNELTIHDWITEVKQFLLEFSNNPIEQQNYIGSGKASKIYTLVEKVDDGHIAYISDRWFLISEEGIKQTLVENHVTDEERLREIRILEQAIQLSEISEDKIDFKIDENLTLSLSIKNANEVFLNEEKLDKETTLESLFNSPIVPYLKRDYYALVLATSKNVSKIVDLDVGLRVTNMLQPQLETYVFNYKDKMYMYNNDQRRGSSFYEYNSANDLIVDVQKELDYDLTSFLENKLSKELKHLRGLEDKEKVVESKIEEILESIELLKDNEELMNENVELKTTFNNLLIHKHNLYKNLKSIKEDKLKAKRSI